MGDNGTGDSRGAGWRRTTIFWWAVISGGATPAALVAFLAQADQSDLEEEARAWAMAALPKFIYFSDFDRREGPDGAARLRTVFGDDVPLLTVGDLLGRPGAMIEDLIPREVYVEAAGQGRLDIPLSEDEQAAATNVEAVAQLFRRTGMGDFDKAEQAKVALALTDNWGRDRSAIPEVTKETARQLAEALNRKLDLRSE